MSAGPGQPNDDEDVKALNFVRKSIMRKNDLIRSLRKQLEELQYEFEALKRKCNNQQNKLDSFAKTDNSPGNDTKECSEDVADMQSEHTQANSIQVKEEILDDNEQPISIENKHLLGNENQPYCNRSENASFSQPTQFEEVEIPVCEETHYMTIENSLVDQAKSGQQSDYTGNAIGMSSDRCCHLREIPQQCLGLEGNQQTGEESRLPGGGTLQVKGTSESQQCSVCGHVTRNEHDLESHLRTHTGEKPFACSLEGCGYRGRNKCDIEKHIRIHTGERPYPCPVAGCANRFRQQSTLARHLRIHTAERLFACSFEGCGYRSSNKCNVKRHIRTHTGEKPFACPVEGCGYRMSRSCSIARHVRLTHQGNRPYACGVQGCGYRAARREQLTKHSRHHARDQI